jgi:hypothetical protein
MEDPRAPKRAALNYAVLSLVVRLIAAQSGVFTLWFGRRAYERSRGELITMLYEKTLSRKVVSISSKPVDEDHSEANGNGNLKPAEHSRWRRAFDFLMRPFRKSQSVKSQDKSKELATMGKIMNLMR